MNIIFMAIVLLFSLTVHESAHAWAAHHFGDDTAKFLGRISLNPIRHIDLFGTIIFPFILIMAGSPVLFGWAKPVPVNPHNLKNPIRDYGWVAFAGPLSNLIIAFLVFVVLKVNLMLNYGEFGTGSYFLYLLMAINLILAVFNLIPIYPLDGGSVLTAILPERHRHLMQPLRQYGFLFLILILFTGVVGKIIGLILGLLNGALGL